MPQLNSMAQMALTYVRNTAGNATRAHFVEDHEPIGESLWQELDNAGLIRVDDNGHVQLTNAGVAAL